METPQSKAEEVTVYNTQKLATMREGECCSLVVGDDSLQLEKLPDGIIAAQKPSFSFVGTVSQTIPVVAQALAQVQTSGLYKLVMSPELLHKFTTGQYALSTLKSSGLATTSLMDNTAVGKYVGSAGLAQAVNPAATVAGVISVVSFVVGQYHLCVISNQLDKINEKLAKIERRFDIEDEAVLQWEIKAVRDLLERQNLNRKNPTLEKRVDFDNRLRDVRTKTGIVLEKSQLLMDDYVKESRRFIKSNQTATEEHIHKMQAIYGRIMLAMQLFVMLAFIEHQEWMDRQDSEYIAKAHKDLQREMKNADDNLSFLLKLFDDELVTRKEGAFFSELFGKVKNHFTGEYQELKRLHNEICIWKEEMEGQIQALQKAPNVVVDYNAATKTARLALLPKLQKQT